MFLYSAQFIRKGNMQNTVTLHQCGPWKSVIHFVIFFNRSIVGIRPNLNDLRTRVYQVNTPLDYKYSILHTGITFSKTSDYQYFAQEYVRGVQKLA